MQAAGGKTLKRTFRFLAVGLWAVGLAGDQLSKEAILARLAFGESIEVIGSFVRFTLIFNPGAAFGLGSNATIGLSVFALLALAGCLLIALPRISTLTQALILGLFLAGISGNLYDRLFRQPGPLLGHVVDFVQLPYFAIFNLADVFITLGAILLLITGFKTPKSVVGVSGGAV